MPRFEDLQLFVRAAALGSFSSAAREAGLLPGQVSAAVKRLEAALQALREGQESIHQHPDEVRGVLQVAASSDLGRNVLLPALTAFRREHPGLVLRLFLSDQLTDVFRDPVDVALRYGRIEDGSFVALPLAPHNRRVLVAAPSYLARRGRPASPQALADHDCLLYLRAGRVYDQWPFTEHGRRHEVQVRGPLLSDDADVVRRWAVAGEGIAFKSWLDVQADVQAGRLELLLPSSVGESSPLSFLCPHRRQFSPAVRRLHAALQRHCEGVMAGLPLLERPTPQTAA